MVASHIYVFTDPRGLNLTALGGVVCDLNVVMLTHNFVIYNFEGNVEVLVQCFLDLYKFDGESIMEWSNRDLSLGAMDLEWFCQSKEYKMFSINCLDRIRPELGWY